MSSLRPTSPTMPCAPSWRAVRCDRRGGAGDEGDVGAERGELPHQRQPEAGGAAGDGDAEAVEVGVGCALKCSFELEEACLLQVQVNLKSSDFCD